MDGFLNLLKPPGMTSSDAVLFVRRRLPRGTKTGHGGTLDPEASGVLPICIGKATRLFDYIVDKEKAYIAEMRLGISTDTQDATGKITQSRPVFADACDVQNALPRFTGEIMQLPPMFSALKRGGKKLYDIARKGETVDLSPRPACIRSIEYLRQTAPDRFLLRVVCGKGVYIRTLVHDIGEHLGCGAHMSFLLRVQSGAFSVEDARTLEEIDRGNIGEMLLPLEAPLMKFPKAVFPESCLSAAQNGNPLPLFLAQSVPEGGELPVAVYVGSRFAGMGQRDNDVLRFKAMLL
ncbi:MAG: tRNA pseudouridine(55) synthase TruB [Christensenellales bacterium]|jgi:tRNA pseudouridine55 synthase